MDRQNEKAKRWASGEPMTSDCPSCKRKDKTIDEVIKFLDRIIVISPQENNHAIQIILCDDEKEYVGELLESLKKARKD